MSIFLVDINPMILFARTFKMSTKNVSENKILLKVNYTDSKSPFSQNNQNLFQQFKF